MTKPTLRDKQIAAGKFNAEQYVLLNKSGSKAKRGSLVRRNLGGRPVSGNGELRLWLSQQAIAWFKMMEETQGLRPGTLVEMLISTMQSEAKLQEAGKSK